MRNKIEFTDELLHYAANTLNNNSSCQQIRYWLRLNDCYSLEYFLQARTLIKYKIITEEHYRVVLNEFKEKEARENQKPYSPTFHFTGVSNKPSNSFFDDLSNKLNRF